MGGTTFPKGSCIMTYRIAGALALVVALASLALSQEKGHEQRKEFPRLGQPGPEHERLKALVGTWDLTSTGFGQESQGSAVYKSILGGRFVTEEVKAPFMGQSMEWLGIYGYDQNKKKYTAVWVDNLDTNTESAEGFADASGRVFNFKGEHPDPRSGRMSAYTWRVSLTAADALEIVMFEDDGTGTQKELARIAGRRPK
jgi:hypothetical protein